MILLCDSAQPHQLGLQDPGTPLMISLIGLHHEAHYMLIAILGIVSYTLARTLLLHTQAPHYSIQPTYNLSHTNLELL